MVQKNKTTQSIPKTRNFLLTHKFIIMKHIVLKAKFNFNHPTSHPTSQNLSAEKPISDSFIHILFTQSNAQVDTFILR